MTMKIVFMGTPDFAVPALEGLIEEFGVCAVYTQPDRPKGRGKKLSMSAVKEVALKNNIPVIQPERLRKDQEALDELKKINPDFIIVVAYGQLLPKEVIDLPKYGCINLHASLLPKYRGAAPVNWAIIKGEEKSGNTTMFMDEGLDTGDMLLKSEIEITPNMTAGELHDKLMADGKEMLINTIKGILSESIERTKQPGDCPFYASMLDKEMAAIDWSKSAQEIHNLVRGMNPWPVAHSKYGKDVMKVYETEVLEKSFADAPGTILQVTGEGIIVACGEGSLLVKKIQFPGGKPLYVSEYVKGNAIEKGIILGA